MRGREAFGARPTFVLGFAVSLWLSGVGGCHASVSPVTVQADHDAAVDELIGTDRWRSVPLSHVCVTAGRATMAKDGWIHIDDPGVRAVVSALPVHAAEVQFVYRGPSRESAQLASGEMRRQIGLKLRAQDTCNVVYVTWHIEPKPGVFVSVKRNPGRTEHNECGAEGYLNLANGHMRMRATPPIARGEGHTLRAEEGEGGYLRVYADDELAWEGALPEAIGAFDGPPGLRSDNGAFDVRLVLPAAAELGAACPSRRVVAE